MKRERISNAIKRMVVRKKKVIEIKKMALDIKVMVKFVLSDGGCSF